MNLDQRQARAAELSNLFALKGWTPSVQNFKPRPFVKWEGNWFSVAGCPPEGGSRSASCQTEKEVVAFLDQEFAPPPAPPPPPEPVPPVIEIRDNPSHLAEIERLRAELEAERNKPPPEPGPPPIRAAEEGVQAIPEELQGLAEADESPDDVRSRLAIELRDLRSLFVGGLYMTDKQKDRLRLLDGPVASEWLKATPI